MSNCHLWIQLQEASCAGRHQALQPPCLVIDSFKAVLASASGGHIKQGPAEQESLVVLWRRAACAAVMLLSIRCKEACQHQKSYQCSKQVSQLAIHLIHEAKHIQGF